MNEEMLKALEEEKEIKLAILFRSMLLKMINRFA